MRIGMIHQPHFLPWPGYVARCVSADVFIVLDNVKFNKNQYQQRTRYIDIDGRERWLGLPITHSTLSEHISNIRIAGTHNWTRWQGAFKHAYTHTPYFKQIWSDIYALIQQESPVLLNVNRFTLQYIINLICDAHNKDVPEFVLASSLHVSSERTQRLIEICSKKEITHLIMGEYALNSHDNMRLQESGISLVRHTYKGTPDRAPLPGITILHDLFLLGRNAVAEQLYNSWHIESLDNGSDNFQRGKSK